MTARATWRGLLTLVGAAPFAGAAAAIPAPHPDADLLRLCGESLVEDAALGGAP